MKGTHTSDTRVTCQSISSAIVSMPISISRLSNIGGKAITIEPIADACMLIRLISMPVCLSSWNVSESFETWSNMSLRRSMTMFCSTFAFT